MLLLLLLEMFFFCHLLVTGRLAIQGPPEKTQKSALATHPTAGATLACSRIHYCFSFQCSALDDATLLMRFLGSSRVSPAQMPAFLGPHLFLASSLWILQNSALYLAHSSDHYVQLQAVCATMQSSPHCLTAIFLHFYTDLIIAIPPNSPLPSLAFP